MLPPRKLLGRASLQRSVLSPLGRRRHPPTHTYTNPPTLNFFVNSQTFLSFFLIICRSDAQSGGGSWLYGGGGVRVLGGLIIAEFFTMDGEVRTSTNRVDVVVDSVGG